MIPRVNGGTAGGSATWNADASGVYYTRYPREGERPAEDLPFYLQIYFHKLGTPVSADPYVLEEKVWVAMHYREGEQPMETPGSIVRITPRTGMSEFGVRFN